MDPYNAPETVSSLSRTGKLKSMLTPSRLVIAGFAAGAYIAFGFILAIISAVSFSSYGTSPNFSLFKILLGAVFPVGLIMVVIGGAELWTGNVSIASYSKFNRTARIEHILYNWIGSYTGNFIGSVFMAFLAVYGTGLFLKSPISDLSIAISHTKVNYSVWQLFWLGVGCNWLVNLAIWLAARSKDSAGKILAIWFPIFAFVAIGFEHSIANMWILTVGAFLDPNITWLQIMKNILFVTLGNGFGALIFVSFYYWYVSTPSDYKVALKELGELLAILLVFTLIMPGIAYLLAIPLTWIGAPNHVFPIVASGYFLVLTFVFHKIKPKGETE
ncbi:MAG TPA: formate/nitrite transporter family protein [Euryarchaeota archaeon]|nr:formate/nitrite transporter family protein [Euryarchaeota archaeon]